MQKYAINYITIKILTSKNVRIIYVAENQLFKLTDFDNTSILPIIQHDLAWNDGDYRGNKPIYLKCPKQ
jgi:hypothetical protein